MASALSGNGKSVFNRCNSGALPAERLWISKAVTHSTIIHNKKPRDVQRGQTALSTELTVMGPPLMAVTAIYRETAWPCG